MAEYKGCTDPQCKKHHIKHKVCNKPDCTICSTKFGPILCDEMLMDTGEVFTLTKRERDIEKILKYFHTTCAQDLLQEQHLPLSLADKFPCIILGIYHYMRKSSEGWTYNIHEMSRKYPKEEIVVTFYQAALHLKIAEPYKEFLKLNNLQHFLPTSLEQLD